MGQYATSKGNASMAIGAYATSTGDYSTAIGLAADSAGDSSVALGNNASASTANSVALGARSTTTADLGAAAYNPGTTVLSGTASGEVSMGSSGNERRVTNVAAGSAATDAVNVSQLQSEAAKSNNIGASAAAALGGGAAYNPTTGTISAPSYSVGGTIVSNMGDAITNIDSRTTQNTANIATNTTNIAGNATAITSIDGRVTSVEGSVTNLTQQLDSGSVGLVQQDATSKAITVARDLDGTTVDFSGTEGVRTLGGVQAGALGDTSTEAVNGSQLYATNQNVTANTASIATNTTNIAGNATAITSIDGRVTSVEGSVTNLTQQLDSGSVGLVQQDATSKAITVARDLDGTTVDFSGTEGVRTLGGVQAGALGDTSTEAVNGSQLYATNQNVTANTASIATNTTNIASNATAITSIDGRVTNVEGSVTNLTQQLDSGSVGLVQQDATSKAITVARDLDGTTVDFSGTEGVRTLGGVQAGALGDTSTEAVNGSQLYATNQNVTANTASIASNTTNIASNATAITSIDGRVTNVEGSVTNLTQQLDGGSVGLVQQDATSKAITVARDLDGTTVDFSGTEGVRTLGGVQAGALGDTSTEAVNGSQLYATNQNVTANTASIAANTTNIASNATAITSIDGRVTNVEGSVTNLTQQLDSGSVGLVQQDATSRAITVARDLDGTTVDFSGTEGVRTLGGVQAGALGDTSTEAVNGSQLYATNQNVTANTASIATNTTNIASNATAITSIDGRVTNVEGSVTNLTQQLDGGSVGLVQQDATSKAITVARDLDGTTVDFSGTEGVRTLGGVQAGALGDTSTEAVNGSQLYATNQNVTANTASIAANTTNIASNATAITSIDGRVTNVEGSVTNLTQQLDSGSVGLVQQDATSKAIMVARDLDGTTVDFSGTEGVRTLGGVQAGALGDTSTEAVNGSQLYATNQNVTANTASIATNTTNIAGNATAITSIDGRVTNVEGSVTNLTQQLDGGSVGLVQQDATSRAITVARNLDGTTVDFSGTEGVRTLSGVADGAVAAGSREAINGSQLYANSASVAAGLGGDSTVNPDGTISAPSYSVGGTTVHSVGDAVTNLDDRVTENTTGITKIQNQLGDVGTQLSGAVQYDRNADGSVNFNSVTLGGGQSAGPVVLTNVANGASQYDAVNFGQLSALQDQVTDLNGQVSNLTGQMENVQPGSPYFDATDVPSASSSDGAEVNAAMPGTGVGSTAAGAGAAASGNYATVIGANASAVADNAVAIGANAAATGVNSTAIGTGSQAANTNSVALGQGSVTDRDNSVSVGSAGNERQITNVAAGTAATDAVNVGQMNSSVAQGVQQANNYADQRFNEANRAINDVAKNAYAGIAAAMAMPNMTPSGPGRTIVAAGGATYKGGSAAAVGATYRSRNGKWLVNGAVSVASTGDAGVRAQVGYEF
ncbi:YadA-like family protein [Paraburkholderia sp. BL10I2N1]|uniref:YadA-like family protein n=1 Tax=Paraburkholderia sp. BL10I2N1 TaxID=1938796 RepID=UPI0032603CB7